MFSEEFLPTYNCVIKYGKEAKLSVWSTWAGLSWPALLSLLTIVPVLKLATWFFHFPGSCLPAMCRIRRHSMHFLFWVLASPTHLPHVVPWNVSLLDESFCSLHRRWSGWCVTQSRQPIKINSHLGFWFPLQLRFAARLLLRNRRQGFLLF